MSQPSKEYKREWARRKYQCDPEAARAKLRRWRAANPEKTKLQRQRDYSKNRELRLEKTRRWRAANPEKVLRQQRNWRNNNRDAYRALARKHYRSHREHYFKHAKLHGKRQAAGLTDAYVRRKLSRQGPVNWRDWPAALVDCKRAQIKLQRLIKSYGSTPKH